MNILVSLWLQTCQVYFIKFEAGQSIRQDVSIMACVISLQLSSPSINKPCFFVVPLHTHITWHLESIVNLREIEINNTGPTRWLFWKLNFHLEVPYSKLIPDFQSIGN